jgi:NAD(P)-dependent dehydrogenase (short-subunit alcohol dehydrogenase family)
VLINNAAIFVPTPINELSVEEWDKVINLNLRAPVFLARSAARHMKENGQGKIINLGDIGAERSWPKYLAYGASKAALLNMTKALAISLAPEIQVNAVCPGIVDWPDNFPDEERKKLMNKVPFKRLVRPEEIARAVVFLAVDAEAITGQFIAVDGGRSLV